MEIHSDLPGFMNWSRQKRSLPLILYKVPIIVFQSKFLDYRYKNDGTYYELYINALTKRR